MTNDYLLNPKRIQFEISSMCNALCLGCVRTDSSNFNHSKITIPNKKMISLDTFKKVVSSSIMKNIDEIEFCGSIDEPLMHPNFIDMIRSAADINPNIKMVIHTNGSLRSTRDWEILASILQRFNKHQVLFSLDGLESTHSIYRQNTDFNTILKNAQAFISSGGYAVWQFLVFPWNKHQINMAKILSEEYKFSEFHLRHDRSISTELGLKQIFIRKRNNKITEISQSSTVDEMIKSFNNVDDLKINCNNKNKGMYFVNYDSRLWPCCFISNGFLSPSKEKVDFLYDRLYKIYGEDFNDLTKKSVEEILESDFYKNDLVESWSNPVGLEKCAKITRCAETCNIKTQKEIPIGSPEVTLIK
jgi:MoaA/NifB/PqqE/SkfB family radical SAM enzyme